MCNTESQQTSSTISALVPPSRHAATTSASISAGLGEAARVSRSSADRRISVRRQRIGRGGEAVDCGQIVVRHAMAPGQVTHVRGESGVADDPREGA
jgi:hypothetical protein